MAFVSSRWAINPAQVSAPQLSPSPAIAPSSPASKPLPSTPKEIAFSAPVNEFLADWVILGFTFAIALVILFLFAGVMDANLAYSLKYFFIYVVLALTVAMLFAGIVEWLVYKKKKIGYFSVGMVLCIMALMAVVLVSSFFPALVPAANAILSNDGPYTKESAVKELNTTASLYAGLVFNGEPGSALRAVYAEASGIGAMDVEFFRAKVDGAAFGPSGGENLYALMVAFGASPESLGAAIPMFGKINTLASKDALAESIVSSPAKMELMQSVSIKAIAVDESKLGNSRPQLAGKYPDSFWVNARGTAAAYLAQYLDFKRQSLVASLDANNYIAAFIEANQLNSLEAEYGK